MRIIHTADYVGKDTQSATHQSARQNSQPVQTVGQIDRIARSDDDHKSQCDKAENSERISKVLEKGNDQVGVRRHLHGKALLNPAHDHIQDMDIARRGNSKSQVDRSDNADQRLPSKLFFRAHSIRIMMNNLAVVIGPADPAKAERDKKHHPHEAVAQIHPQ